MTDPRTLAAPTVGQMLAARAGDDAPGLVFEEQTWTWAEVVAESARRAARLRALLPASGPRHVGVLLENVPEYLFWLGAAALDGVCVVGINPTRRGIELGRDVCFTDCRLLVTDGPGAAVLRPLDTGVPDELILEVPTGASAAAPTGEVPPPRVSSAKPEDLLLLLFTSGTTGAPKAVRCSQGRLAAIATRAAELYDFRRDDVCYCPMPLFHGNAVMALWAPALAVGATVALARRFSASRFLSDVRRHGATRFTYVGKALAYVLTTPEHPDDADNTLRVGFGTEASGPDREQFSRRFGCALVEGYGSSEGGVSINVTPDTPPGSLGLPPAGLDVAVCDSEGNECPPAAFEGGRLVNAAACIGEIVNRSGASGFEGYYANGEADATRTRHGWYWTGDLGYRDEDGYFYFAGRGGDWLRVDSENFAAAPVERILERHPDIAAAAVYPVPDPRTGDRVMAALQLRPGAAFDAPSFAGWLHAQPDLGTKWAPGFVRLCAALPTTATGKITKTVLRADAWECDDTVFVARPRHEGYEPLDDEGRRALREELGRHGRLDLLTRGRSRLSASDVL